MSKEKAVRAGAWSALDIVLRQGVGFVVSVILARLLGPADFGLMSLLAFFSSLSVVFVQGGLTLALVQRTESSHEQENAVFWTNFLFSLFFALILIAVAPVVARFYGYPAMNSLMYVIAAQVVLSALGAVQTSLLTRSLRFDQLTKTGIFTSLASAAAGIAAALAGWGVWALALQLLVNAAVSTGALWWVSDWRPAWRFTFAPILDLFGFGARISMSSMLEMLYSNGFLMVIGKVYSVGELGIFTRAATTTSFPPNIVAAIISRTALPLFSQRAGDPDALRRGFRSALGLSMLLSLPVMAGLGVLSDLVTLVLFGPKWLAAAPIMAITALSGALLPLHILNLNLMLSLGDTKTFLQVEVLKKITGFFIVGIGCFFGLLGIAWAALAAAIVAFYLNARSNKAAISYGPAQQLYDLWKMLVSVSVMALAVYMLKVSLNLAPWLELVVLTTIGAAIYFTMLWVLRSSDLIEAWHLGKGVLVGVSRRHQREIAPI